MEDKFYGIYRGTCVDNEDPESLNRIRLECPQILHTNVTNWAWPCNPIVLNGEHGTSEGLDVQTSASSASSTGSSSPASHSHTMAHTHTVSLSAHIKVPNLGQGVWVMFEGGDPNFPVWIGTY